MSVPSSSSSTPSNRVTEVLNNPFATTLGNLTENIRNISQPGTRSPISTLVNDIQQTLVSESLDLLAQSLEDSIQNVTESNDSQNQNEP